MENKLTRKEQAQITKKNIYTAAISLIESKGFENVSIEDITTKANTAKGTFYIYFKSKQDLIYHTISMYDEIAKKSYEKVQYLESFEEQLVAFLQFTNREILGLGEKILSALLVHNLIAEKKFITVKSREIYIAFGKIIAKGYETGELSSDFDEEYYMETIVIFVQGLDYYCCNTAPDFDYPKATKREAEIFVRGLIGIYGKK